MEYYLNEVMMSGSKSLRNQPDQVDRPYPETIFNAMAIIYI
jgi:hypothetical protein